MRLLEFLIKQKNFLKKSYTNFCVKCTCFECIKVTLAGMNYYSTLKVLKLY